MARAPFKLKSGNSPTKSVFFGGGTGVLTNIARIGMPKGVTDPYTSGADLGTSYTEKKDSKKFKETKIGGGKVFSWLRKQTSDTKRSERRTKIRKFFRRKKKSDKPYTSYTPTIGRKI